MDEEKIRENCRTYKNAMDAHFEKALPVYASKAASFMRMYEIISEEGLGIDVVSVGEIYTAMKAGMGVGIITGRSDPCVLARMSQLGVTEYHAGFESKLPKLEAIRRKYGLEWDEMAYVGDDWRRMYDYALANGFRFLSYGDSSLLIVE